MDDIKLFVRRVCSEGDMDTLSKKVIREQYKAQFNKKSISPEEKDQISQAVEEFLAEWIAKNEHKLPPIPVAPVTMTTSEDSSAPSVSPHQENTEVQQHESQSLSPNQGTDAVCTSLKSGSLPTDQDKENVHSTTRQHQSRPHLPGQAKDSLDVRRLAPEPLSPHKSRENVDSRRQADRTCVPVVSSQAKVQQKLARIELGQQHQKKIRLSVDVTSYSHNTQHSQNSKRKQHSSCSSSVLDKPGIISSERSLSTAVPPQGRLLAGGADAVSPHTEGGSSEATGAHKQLFLVSEISICQSSESEFSSPKESSESEDNTKHTERAADDLLDQKKQSSSRGDLHSSRNMTNTLVLKTKDSALCQSSDDDVKFIVVSESDTDIGVPSVGQTKDPPVSSSKLNKNQLDTGRKTGRGSKSHASQNQNNQSSKYKETEEHSSDALSVMNTAKEHCAESLSGTERTKKMPAKRLNLEVVLQAVMGSDSDDGKDLGMIEGFEYCRHLEEQKKRAAGGQECENSSALKRMRDADSGRGTKVHRDTKDARKVGKDGRTERGGSSIQCRSEHTQVGTCLCKTDSNRAAGPTQTQDAKTVLNSLCHTTPSAQLRGGRCVAKRVNQMSDEPSESDTGVDKGDKPDLDRTLVPQESELSDEVFMSPVHQVTDQPSSMSAHIVIHNQKDRCLQSVLSDTTPKASGDGKTSVRSDESVIYLKTSEKRQTDDDTITISDESDRTSQASESVLQSFNPSMFFGKSKIKERDTDSSLYDSATDSLFSPVSTGGERTVPSTTTYYIDSESEDEPLVSLTHSGPLRSLLDRAEGAVGMDGWWYDTQSGMITKRKQAHRQKNILASDSEEGTPVKDTYKRDEVRNESEDEMHGTKDDMRVVSGKLMRNEDGSLMLVTETGTYTIEEATGEEAIQSDTDTLSTQTAYEDATHPLGYLSGSSDSIQRTPRWMLEKAGKAEPRPKKRVSTYSKVKPLFSVSSFDESDHTLHLSALVPKSKKHKESELDCPFTLGKPRPKRGTNKQDRKFRLYERSSDSSSALTLPSEVTFSPKCSAFEISSESTDDTAKWLNKSQCSFSEFCAEKNKMESETLQMSRRQDGSLSKLHARKRSKEAFERRGKEKSAPENLRKEEKLSASFRRKLSQKGEKEKEFYPERQREEAEPWEVQKYNGQQLLNISVVLEDVLEKGNHSSCHPHVHMSYLSQSATKGRRLREITHVDTEEITPKRKSVFVDKSATNHRSRKLTCVYSRDITCGRDSGFIDELQSRSFHKSRTLMDVDSRHTTYNIDSDSVFSDESQSHTFTRLKAKPTDYIPPASDTADEDFAVCDTTGEVILASLIEELESPVRQQNTQQKADVQDGLFKQQDAQRKTRSGDVPPGWSIPPQRAPPTPCYKDTVAVSDSSSVDDLSCFEKSRRIRSKHHADEKRQKSYLSFSESRRVIQKEGRAQKKLRSSDQKRVQLNPIQKQLSLEFSSGMGMTATELQSYPAQRKIQDLTQRKWRKKTEYSSGDDLPLATISREEIHNKKKTQKSVTMRGLAKTRPSQPEHESRKELQNESKTRKSATMRGLAKPKPRQTEHENRRKLTESSSEDDLPLALLSRSETEKKLTVDVKGKLPISAHALFVKENQSGYLQPLFVKEKRSRNAQNLDPNEKEGPVRDKGTYESTGDIVVNPLSSPPPSTYLSGEWNRAEWTEDATATKSTSQLLDSELTSDIGPVTPPAVSAQMAEATIDSDMNPSSPPAPFTRMSEECRGAGWAKDSTSTQPSQFCASDTSASDTKNGGLKTPMLSSQMPESDTTSGSEMKLVGHVTVRTPSISSLDIPSGLGMEEDNLFTGLQLHDLESMVLDDMQSGSSDEDSKKRKAQQMESSDEQPSPPPNKKKRSAQVQSSDEEEDCLPLRKKKKSPAQVKQHSSDEEFESLSAKGNGKSVQSDSESNFEEKSPPPKKKTKTAKKRADSSDEEFQMPKTKRKGNKKPVAQTQSDSEDEQTSKGKKKLAPLTHSDSEEDVPLKVKQKVSPQERTKLYDAGLDSESEDEQPLKTVKKTELDSDSENEQPLGRQKKTGLGSESEDEQPLKTNKKKAQLDSESGSEDEQPLKGQKNSDFSSDSDSEQPPRQQKNVQLDSESDSEDEQPLKRQKKTPTQPQNESSDENSPLRSTKTNKTKQKKASMASESENEDESPLKKKTKSPVQAQSESSDEDQKSDLESGATKGGRKEKPHSKKQRSDGESDMDTSGLSSDEGVIDRDDEQPRKSRKKTKTSEKKEQKKRSRKSSGSESKSKSNASKKSPSGEEDPYLKRLKLICRKVGIFVRNDVHFAGCKTDKQKIERLKEALKKAGMKGQPSLSKVDEVNLMREAAALDAGNIIETSGRPRRQPKGVFTRGESPPKSLTPVKQEFSRIKDLIDSDSD